MTDTRNTYRWMEAQGWNEDRANCDLSALRLARLYTGNPSLRYVDRLQDGAWVRVYLSDMLRAGNAAANVRRLYGSGSKRMIARAERDFGLAA